MNQFWPVLAQFRPCGGQKKKGKLGFLGILKRIDGSNGLKCGMLMCPDHLQKRFDFGHFWPSFDPLVAKILGEIGVSGHSKGTAWRLGMVWNVACWCILTTSKIYSILASIQYWHNLGPLVATTFSMKLCFQAFQGKKMHGGRKGRAEAYTVYSRYIPIGGVQPMVPRYKWERDISGDCHEPKSGTIFQCVLSDNGAIAYLAANAARGQMI